MMIVLLVLGAKLIGDGLGSLELIPQKPMAAPWPARRSLAPPRARPSSTTSIRSAWPMQRSRRARPPASTALVRPGCSPQGPAASASMSMPTGPSGSSQVSKPVARPGHVDRFEAGGRGPAWAGAWGGAGARGPAAGGRSGVGRRLPSVPRTASQRAVRSGDQGRRQAWRSPAGGQAAAPGGRSASVKPMPPVVQVDAGATARTGAGAEAAGVATGSATRPAGHRSTAAQVDRPTPAAPGGRRARAMASPRDAWPAPAQVSSGAGGSPSASACSWQTVGDGRTRPAGRIPRPAGQARRGSSGPPRAGRAPSAMRAPARSSE